MTKKTILKKDYIFILILVGLHFLTTKNVIPNAFYLLLAIVGGLYFFPIRLFLDHNLFNEKTGKRISKLLSYFIVSGIVVFSALLFYINDRNNFLVNTFLVYGLLNIILFFYFYLTEGTSYNFILTLCASFLVSVPIMAH